MKKNIILLMTAVFGVFVLAGCSEDDLKKTSAVLDSPTVGVDIANKEGIYQIARDLAEQGMAVLMICDEIPEAYYNSHRVLVMRRGRLVAEFNPHHCREEEIAEVVEVINE